MNAIIIDDEKFARENLKLSLSEVSNDITIVGEANNVDSAIEIVNNIDDIHVVFLDIQMPEKNGFEFIRLTKNKDFHIVIVTAFDEYKITAIRESAFDYILKPIVKSDLEQLVIRLQNAIDNRINVDREHNLSFLVDLLANNRKEKDVIVYYPYGYRIVKESDILLIQGDNNRTLVHLRNGEVIKSTMKMKDFELTLDPSSFFRVHKSYIVNLSHVREYFVNGANYLSLTNKLKVDISRKYLDDFHIAMKKYIENKNKGIF